MSGNSNSREGVDRQEVKVINSRSNLASGFYDQHTIYVGKLILRPAKITPSEFQWLDPLLSDSRDKDAIILRAKGGRERGYFANGLVTMSTSEEAHGVVLLVNKAAWRDSWGCLEVIHSSNNYARAIVSPIPLEDVEDYYRWVYRNPENLNISFDVWKAEPSLRKV